MGPVGSRRSRVALEFDVEGVEVFGEDRLELLHGQAVLVAEPADQAAAGGHAAVNQEFAGDDVGMHIDAAARQEPRNFLDIITMAEARGKAANKDNFAG